MSTRQFQGKTVEEATNLALEELKVNLEEINVEVINPGRSGILGLGGEPAIIEVTFNKQLSPEKRGDRPSRKNMDVVDKETEELAVDLVNYILSSLQAEVKTFFREQNEFEANSVYFEIEGDDSGLIIGRKGETLKALEFLISFIIKRQLDKQVKVILDVEGYQDRRRENLISLAESSANEAIKTGKPVKMDPMSPFDRRIVHLALENKPDISTESKGSGSRRQVIIFPETR